MSVIEVFANERQAIVQNVYCPSRKLIAVEIIDNSKTGD